MLLRILHWTQYELFISDANFEIAIMTREFLSIIVFWLLATFKWNELHGYNGFNGDGNKFLGSKIVLIS